MRITILDQVPLVVVGLPVFSIVITASLIRLGHLLLVMELFLHQVIQVVAIALHLASDLSVNFAPSQAMKHVGVRNCFQ